MKIILALVVSGTFHAAVLAAAPTSLSVENIDTTCAGAGSSVLRRNELAIKTRLQSDEVLTVRVTRWESGVKILETEEVVVSGENLGEYRITLAELAADYWHLSDLVADQHVQGVRLESLAAAKSRVELRLVSKPDAAPRVYRFTWEAKVEPWRAVKKRHAHLPELKPGFAWHSRRVISAAALKARF